MARAWHTLTDIHTHCHPPTNNIHSPPMHYPKQQQQKTIGNAGEARRYYLVCLFSHLFNVPFALLISPFTHLFKLVDFPPAHFDRFVAVGSESTMNYIKKIEQDSKQDVSVLSADKLAAVVGSLLFLNQGSVFVRAVCSTLTASFNTMALFKKNSLVHMFFNSASVGSAAAEAPSASPIAA